jgi:DNA-directed RNA polymerase subunit alpha
MEITTNGAVGPEFALKQASGILIQYYQQVIEPKAAPVKAPVEVKFNPTLRLTVEELDLPIRIANALRRAGYSTVADLVRAKIEDLYRVKNLGEKSINLVAEALSKKEVKLGQGTDET